MRGDVAALSVVTLEQVVPTLVRIPAASKTNEAFFASYPSASHVPPFAAHTSSQSSSLSVDRCHPPLAPLPLEADGEGGGGEGGGEATASLPAFGGAGGLTVAEHQHRRRRLVLVSEQLNPVVRSVSVSQQVAFPSAFASCKRGTLPAVPYWVLRLLVLHVRPTPSSVMSADISAAVSTSSLCA